MTRLALLERLKELQQTPKYQGRDITTVSAMLSMSALAKHVELCEAAAAVPPRHDAAGKAGGTQAHAGRA
ncbi:hypothetical protein FY036_05160 [Mesorhizobium microcysteis]|uniref:Uncharacterized protein n=1 Tax=Neoaquamicrobium microcysteis TaxID=2682781 RepID=A0A5D4H650_9HYPH|nr:hypothetical protein [Mesorhizobium microcysteis]TYR34300.1 hypothetical protein FY036_05160 [Mesorhizobium microcysteis]